MIRSGHCVVTAAHGHYGTFGSAGGAAQIASFEPIMIMTQNKAEQSPAWPSACVKGSTEGRVTHGVWLQTLGVPFGPGITAAFHSVFTGLQQPRASDRKLLDKQQGITCIFQKHSFTWGRLQGMAMLLLFCIVFLKLYGFMKNPWFMVYDVFDWKYSCHEKVNG